MSGHINDIESQVRV